jgi:hypothetical protein
MFGSDLLLNIEKQDFLRAAGRLINQHVIQKGGGVGLITQIR